jgi:hypothetical protein
MAKNCIAVANFINNNFKDFHRIHDFKEYFEDFNGNFKDFKKDFVDLKG